MPTKPAFSRLVLVLSGLLLSAASTGAFAASKATIKNGEQLYNQNCSVCHQADAIGKAGFAPSLTNPELLSISSDKFFESTIRDGRPGTGMPPWSHLGRKKIKAIVAYLRSHAKLPDRSAAVDNEKESHGDPRLGKQWFEDICATCHGQNGNGYASGGTGTAIGMSGFQNKVSDGFIRETIRNGRSNTRMLGFSDSTGLAHLSAEEIDDVIAYMRTLPKKN
jgi:cbb3-type cytochrome c oxidase subunit III